MQHLALWVAWLLRDNASPWQLLAMGSDGSDGATEDAGALVDQDSIQLALQLGWDVEKTLRDFDAGSLLEDIGALIITGDTGSNVNDMMILEVLR
jgi:glycerate-2-kinase